MLGSWIRKQVGEALYEHSMSAKPITMGTGAYGNPYIVVHVISNGYLLQSGSTLVYCKDQKEISDQIITLHARERMGVSSDVSIGPFMSSGSNKL